MKKHSLTVNKRSLSQNLNLIRKENRIPGNIFGPDIDSQAIVFESKDFVDLFKEVGESAVVYLQLEKKEIPAMVDEVQINPVTNDPIHISFKTIDLTEKVEAQIPVELVGEFELPEAVLVTVRDEIEVRALPADLPEKFIINVEDLDEIGQSITLADLDYDQEKVEIVVGEEGMEAPVVLVQEVEEEPEEPEEPVETEIIGEGGEEGEEGGVGEAAEGVEEPEPKEGAEEKTAEGDKQQE